MFLKILQFFNMKKTLIWAIMLCQTIIIHAQAPCPPSASKNIHVVQKGETLYGISKQHKLSITQLTQLNNLDKNAILLPCSALKLVQFATKSVSQKKEAVPQMYGNTMVVSAKRLPKPTPPVAYSYSNAVANDNSEVAETTPDDGGYIQNPSVANASASVRPNNLASPNYSYFSQSPFVPFYHITIDGETPQSVGGLHGLSETDVMMMNNLTSNARMVAGQKLVLEHRNQRKTQDYILESIDNRALFAGQGNSETPQSYNQSTPQYSEPNYANANEFGSRPTQPVEEMTEQPSEEPKPQPAQPNPLKNANKTPLSSNTSMTSEEMDMVREINLMRQNPAGYVQYIKEYIGHLKQSGDMSSSIQTSYELIDELEKTPTLSTLQPLQCVYTAAKKHGEDQKRRGDTDHTGSDGSMPWDRVLRECPDLKDGNENLVGGPSDIRRAVILLLVDDGIDSRGHRKTLLNPEWQYVACYKMGIVGSMPNCWVQNFGY
jgi:uncharacterized protein YkwD